MSDRDNEAHETFFARWSRVKNQARDETAAPPARVEPPLAEDDKAPELPPVEALTADSDFSAFFHPKVDEDVRRSALRKLFSDPRFNVMDGLDVYIDDYSKTEPLPAAMLASLQQAQRIFAWAAEKDEKQPAEAPPGKALEPQPPALEASEGDSVPLPVTDAPAAPGRST